MLGHTNRQADSLYPSEHVDQAVWCMPVQAPDGSEPYGSVVVNAYGGHQGIAVTLLGSPQSVDPERFIADAKQDLLIADMAVQSLPDGSLRTYDPLSPRFINVSAMETEGCGIQIVIMTEQPPYALGPVSMEADVACRASHDALYVASRVATLLYPDAPDQTLTIQAEDRIGDNLSSSGLELY
jgi:hypothetical protein